MKYVVVFFLLITSYVGVASTPSPNYKVVKWGDIEQILSKDDDTLRIINFWATWCAPCIKELPDFEKINADYAEDRVQVYLISLDDKLKSADKLRQFIVKKGLQSPVMLLDEVDFNTWLPKIDEDWSGAIPATLITYREKKEFVEGSLNYSQIEGLIINMRK